MEPREIRPVQSTNQQQPAQITSETESIEERTNRVSMEPIAKYALVGGAAGTVVGGPLGTVGGAAVGATIGGIEMVINYFSRRS